MSRRRSTAILVVRPAGILGGAMGLVMFSSTREGFFATQVRQGESVRWRTKFPLLRFPRDVRLISFTVPAGADAAE